jgi:hypothetical protein
VSYTFGQRNDHVMRDAFGDPLAQQTLRLYATKEDAEGGVNELASVFTDRKGRWTYEHADGVLWVKEPDGDVTSLLAPESLGSTYATGGQVRSKVKTDGTDQTATLQAELNALRAAGGGTLLLPSGTVTINGTITLGNDGAVPAKQPYIKLAGHGTHWSGRGTAPQGGTFLDIKGTDTYGKLKTNGLGLLVITGVTFKDSAGTTTPFVYTTNTTLHIDQCAFVGSKAGTACDQDAIVCGGTDNIEGQSGWNDGFQGYGTVISRNFFHGIRRAVYGRRFFNANVIRDNTVWTTCGHTGGASIEIDGDPVGNLTYATGNVITGNLIEVPNYAYAIRLKNATRNQVIANHAYDATGTTVAAVTMQDRAQYNLLVDGFVATGYPGLTEAGNAAGTTTRVASDQSVPSTFGQGIKTLVANILNAAGSVIASFQGIANIFWVNVGSTTVQTWYSSSGGGSAIGGDRATSNFSVLGTNNGKPHFTVRRYASATNANLVEVMTEAESILTRIDAKGRVVTKASTAPVLADLADGEVALFTDGTGALKIAYRVAGVLTTKTVTVS